MAMPLPLPTFTTDDLRAFPEDGQRYELLEGMLLVTPMPGSAHQVVLSRILVALAGYLSPADRAVAVSPGEIEIAPKTLLEPDLLVFPASYPPGTPWSEMRDWWLAVEVFSPSSRVYDRDFKRDAYLALGVAEVWLVDLDERAVFVSSRGGQLDDRRDASITWRPREMPDGLEIDLSSIFRGVP
ncbi:MAG TPA: Uma2 family endonuclease [Gemmatimonadaceae bacterium]|nr:Uma2 family endonuclease [Gemmatimonadaceae bacterium]